MNQGADVFSFLVLRPPEALKGGNVSRRRLPSIAQMGGPATARKFAAELERLHRSGELAIEDENEEQLKKALMALVHFGSSGTLLRRVAAHVEDRMPDGGAEPPMVSRLRDTIPPLVVDDLDLRRIFSDDTDDSPLPEVERRAHFGPVGIGDLMIVEQHLLRYELGEVAYIENVMATEFRERVHRHLNEIETLFVEEEEREASMEQDLQSAERFELQTAAEQELSQRSQLDSSVQVSASYGPTVEVEASLSYSLENAKQQSSRRASTFARDVVERSVKKTQERFKERREERRRSQTEHTNTHRFDNTGPEAEHVTGVYRYVDKVYQMKLVNRGVRFFYEFILPEPAAYLRHLGSAAPRSRLKPPTRHPETIASITPDSYRRIVRKYGLKSVPPPPSGFINAVEVFSDRDTGKDGAQRFLKEGTITIEEGYMAVRARATVTTFKQHSTDPDVRITVGNTTVNRTDNWPSLSSSRMPSVFEFNLDDQRRNLGYLCYVRHDSTVQVALEVRLEPTPESITEWQHRVYDAIEDTYQAALAEYNAAVAEEQAGTSAQLNFGEPPQRLRELERTEIKRLCLQLLGQEAARVDPLNEGTIPPLNEGAIPLVVERDEAPLEEGNKLVDLDRLEPLSQEIRFGEQAFEWSGMTFVLYPYYWADPNHWAEIARLEHPDPQHATFLRAGAARVLVPVRRHFEDAVHNFLVLGRKALDGAEDVGITSQRWLPLYQEIKEAQNAPAAQREVVECWSARLPTTLVKLDLEDSLPTFDVPQDCPEDV